jgi:hypothetical protein
MGILERIAEIENEVSFIEMFILLKILVPSTTTNFLAKCRI